MRFLVLVMLAMPAALVTAQRNAPACDSAHMSSLEQGARQALAAASYTTAAEQFQAAHLACPGNRNLLLDLSRAQALARRFDAAIASAQQYLDSEPGSIAGRLALANAYFMAQHFGKAQSIVAEILSIQPDNVDALKIKANAEYLLGDSASAINTLIQLLEHYPVNVDGAYMLGRIYYSEKSIDQAIGQFERVLRLEPESYKALDNLGLCYQARNQNDLAGRYFLAAIKVVEKNRIPYDWPYANLSDLLFKNDNAQQAFDAAAKAADLNPLSARDFYLGGKALERLGKQDLALNWLQRSASLDPSYAEPQYLLAQIYHRIGKEAQAKEALKKFEQAKASQKGAKRAD